MTSFARSTRQGVIWDRLNAIRETAGDGALISPDDAGYTGDDGELQIEYAALLVEYAAIHTTNESKG